MLLSCVLKAYWDSSHSEEEESQHTSVGHTDGLQRSGHPGNVVTKQACVTQEGKGLCCILKGNTTNS